MTYVPSDYEIETYTGRFVDTNDPDPNSIALEDIAHALAFTCRYGGHCTRFYSVAEHSVLCSRRMERQGASLALQMAALHHDDAEAYLGDIPRPLKPLLGVRYVRMTRRMDAAIVKALSLAGDAANFHDPRVKAADNWALFVEARKLLPSEGRQWWKGGQGADSWDIDLPSRIVHPDYWLGGLAPEAAEELFITRHKALEAKICD